MSATPLPAASENPPAPNVPPPGSLAKFRVAASLTLAWVLFLAGLTWRTANPPVVNRVQIRNSEYILVGRWENRQEGRLEVVQELKRGVSLGVVTVTGLPERGLPAAKSWVIPVTRFGGAYSVTHGQFLNSPRQPQPDGKIPHWQIDVPPQCYPATDDVLEQILAVLAAPIP